MKRPVLVLTSLIMSTSILFSACSSSLKVSEEEGITQMQVLNDTIDAEEGSSSNAAYEIFVGSFCDSDGDGTGDLAGIVSSLDYIESTGFDMIWLTPVCESPTYHKYDVADYLTIDSEFGTMEDYETLIEECHSRGIRVITDFVMNHTSSQNEWFVEACEALRNSSSIEEAAGLCPYVNYYNFTTENSSGYTQVSGTDFYYESQFWSEMPDLNLMNEDVRAELEEIAAFWLSKGTDGFRLDATTYYVTGADQSNIEILSWFSDYVKSVNPDAYIVCEAWTDPGVYLTYYQSGVDSMFNFKFSGQNGTIAAVASGRSPAMNYGIAIEDYQTLISEESGGSADITNDAPFYTNHDMGRSAGYFAGDESEARTKLAGALNLLMSGHCFVYYGEEIGMKGSGKDENFRAPMYWSEDSSRSGMCDGPADMDSFEMKFPSLEVQTDDPLSIYNYYRHAVELRILFPAIASGTTELIEDLSDDNICVIKKSAEGMDDVLIVINTSADSHEIDISGAGDFDELSAVLAVSYEEAALDGSTLTIPGFFIVVITAD